MELLLPHCTVIPATNQIELHPCLPSFELKKYCEEKGILLTAYSPFGEFQPKLHKSDGNDLFVLGQGNSLFFKDPDFVKISEDHKVSVAQIAVSWALQRGTVPIPKSANVERMTANITVSRLLPLLAVHLINSNYKDGHSHPAGNGYH